MYILIFLMGVKKPAFAGLIGIEFLNTHLNLHT